MSWDNGGKALAMPWITDHCHRPPTMNWTVAPPRSRDSSGAWRRPGFSEVPGGTLLTASTPPGKTLGMGVVSPDEFVIWKLNMKRSDRTLWILTLLVSGLGLLHYTMWRIAQAPVGYRPKTPESYLQAMVSAFRHLRRASTARCRGNRLVVVAGGRTVPLGHRGCHGLARRTLWRPLAGTYSLRTRQYIGCAGLLDLPDSTSFLSRLGTLVHGCCGAITGSSFAWLLWVVAASFMSVGAGVMVMMLSFVSTNDLLVTGYLTAFAFAIVISVQIT